MARHPDPPAEPLYAALWLGAMLVAARQLADPFPAELDELAAEYFALFPPAAKA